METRVIAQLARKVSTHIYTTQLIKPPRDFLRGAALYSPPGHKSLYRKYLPTEEKKIFFQDRASFRKQNIKKKESPMRFHVYTFPSYTLQTHIYINIYTFFYIAPVKKK